MAIGDKPAVSGLTPPRAMPVTGGEAAVKAPEQGKVYVTAKGDDVLAVVDKAGLKPAELARLLVLDAHESVLTGKNTESLPAGVKLRLPTQEEVDTKVSQLQQEALNGLRRPEVVVTKQMDAPIARTLTKNADKRELRLALKVELTPQEMKAISFKDGGFVVNPDLNHDGKVSDEELGRALDIALSVASKTAGAEALHVDGKGRIVVTSAADGKDYPLAMAILGDGDKSAGKIDGAAVRQSFEAHRYAAAIGMDEPNWKSSTIKLDRDKDGTVSDEALQKALAQALDAMALRPGDEYVTFDRAGNLVVAKLDAKAPPAAALMVLPEGQLAGAPDGKTLRGAYDSLVAHAKQQHAMKLYGNDIDEARRALVAGKPELAKQLFDRAEKRAKAMPDPQREMALLNLDGSRATAFYAVHDYAAGDAALARLHKGGAKVAELEASIKRFKAKAQFSEGVQKRVGEIDKLLVKGSQGKPGSAEAVAAGKAAMAESEKLLKDVKGEDALLVRYKLATGALLAGDYAKADDILGELVKRGGTTGFNASVLLAESYKRQGKPESQLSTLKAAYEANPKLGAQLYAAALLDQKKYSDALALAAKLGGGEGSIIEAQTHFAQGNATLAMKDLDKAMADPATRERAHKMKGALEAKYFEIIADIYKQNVRAFHQSKAKYLEPSGWSLLNPINSYEFITEYSGNGVYSNRLKEYEQRAEAYNGDEIALKYVTQAASRLPAPITLTSLLRMTPEKRTATLRAAGVGEYTCDLFNKLMTRDNPDLALLAGGNYNLDDFGKKPYIDSSFMYNWTDSAMQFVGEVTKDARDYDESLKKSSSAFDRAVGYGSAAILDTVSDTNQAIKATFKDAREFWDDVGSHSQSTLVQGGAALAFALASGGEMVASTVTSPLTLADYKATLDERRGALLDTVLLVATAGLGKGVAGGKAFFPKGMAAWMERSPTVRRLVTLNEKFVTSNTGKAINAFEKRLGNTAFAKGFDKVASLPGKVMRMEVGEIPGKARALVTKPKLTGTAPPAPGKLGLTAAPEPPINVGQKVKLEGAEWHVAEAGPYGVRLKSGSVEIEMAIDDLMRHSPDTLKGLEVQVMHNGQWHRALVAEVGPDGASLRLWNGAKGEFGSSAVKMTTGEASTALRFREPPAGPNALKPTGVDDAEKVALPNLPPVELKVGQRVRVMRSGTPPRLEEGWTITNRSGGLVEVTSGNMKKVVPQSELANLNKLQPGSQVSVIRSSGEVETWRIVDVKPNGECVLKSYDNTMVRTAEAEELLQLNNIRPGIEVNVPRSSGAIETDWVIGGDVTKKGFVRVHKQGNPLMYKDVPVKDLMAHNRTALLNDSAFQVHPPPARPAGKVSAAAKQQAVGYQTGHRVEFDQKLQAGFVDGGRGQVIKGTGEVGSGREVLVFDPARDEVVRKALAYAKSLTGTELEKAEAIARYVDEIMSPGGRDLAYARAAGDTKLGIKSWSDGMAGHEVLLGDVPSLGGGACRHRAPLVKAMADEAGLQMAIQRGNMLMDPRTGQLGPHVWNELKLPNGQKYVVDAMNPPSNWAFPKLQKAGGVYYDAAGARLY